MPLMLVYRALNSLGLVKGSSSPGEFRGVMPHDYFTAMAPCQVRRGLKEMAQIDENIGHRREMTAFYHRELSKIGSRRSGCRASRGCRCCGIPSAWRTRPNFGPRRRKGIEIGSWFECPLHPEGTRHEDFGYETGCARIGTAAREVVNLPTHLNVKQRTAEGCSSSCGGTPRRLDESMLKRLFDIVASSLGLLLLSPVLAVIAATVRIGRARCFFGKSGSDAAAAVLNIKFARWFKTPRNSVDRSPSATTLALRGSGGCCDERNSTNCRNCSTCCAAMANLQAALRSEAGMDGMAPVETARVVTRLNRHFCRSLAEGRFATFFYGVYDLEARTLQYTNAGHLPPVCISNGEIRKLEAGGMVLGIFDDRVYQQETVPNARDAVFRLQRRSN